ncbi:MAG TPA: hypothetical protein PLG43_02835 [Spirochaetia bacterium]|nr:hypothetical protein [Spirochaetia bacterium]
MNERFLNQVELALLLGVSRQRIFSLTKKGVLTKDSSGIYDLENPVNAAYLESRKSTKASKQVRPISHSQKPSVPAGMRIDADDEDESDEEDESMLALKIRKLKTEIIKKELEIAQVEGSVIDERIISSLIGELGQGIRLNFIDVCLRQSEQICAMLGVPGREREVQEYLEVDNGRRLEEVKRGVSKIMHTMKRGNNEHRLENDEGKDHE